MNRSSFRLLAAALVGLLWGIGSQPTFAQSQLPQLGNPVHMGTAPAGYVSPQERIKAANPGTLGQAATARPLQAGDKITHEQTGAGPVCTKRNCVPVVGRTADQKYPVYGIQGELDDINYRTADGKFVYQQQDLFKRMGYVETTDVKGHGIQCDFVCKNGAGQIVGLNPQVRWMEAKVK